MFEWYDVLQGWGAMDGRWHHYALVYDWNETTSDIVRLYRDGVKVTTHFATSKSAARLRTDRLYIGRRADSNYPFIGELDDIKITGRVLTPAEFMTKRSVPKGIVISFK